MLVLLFLFFFLLIMSIQRETGHCELARLTMTDGWEKKLHDRCANALYTPLTRGGYGERHGRARRTAGGRQQQRTHTTGQRRQGPARTHTDVEAQNTRDLADGRRTTECQAGADLG